jgi:glutamate carboxypeptidase
VPAPVADLVDRCTRLLPVVISDIERMVLAESPSNDLEAVARSAAVVAELGDQRMGAPPEYVAIEGCTHLRWRFGSGPRRAVVLCHHDTVWPIGSLDDHPWVDDGEVLRGPGCFDMKTGTAMAMHSVALLGELYGAAAVDGLTVLVTGDEEVGSRTSRELIEQEARGCAAAFVLEASGPGGALKTERKGVSMYEVGVVGRAAHAGLEPERGVNAAVELAHQVLAIADLGDSTLGTTVTPTMLRAGTSSNTVPARAVVSVDVRASSREEQQRVDDAMHALTVVTAGARLTVAGDANRPPFAPASSSAVFERARLLAPHAGIDSLTGMAVGGGSDGNFTADIGTPTLDGLGAVGGGAHADDEHVLVAEIPHRLALLTLLLADVLGTEVEPSLRTGTNQTS